MAWKQVKVIDKQYPINQGVLRGLFFCAYNETRNTLNYMADHKLYQDSKTGKLVEFISKHDKEFAMVRDAGGNVTFLTLDQLVPYDKDKGRLAKIEAPELHVPEEQAPVTVVPSEDMRLNLNTAQADQISKRLPGVGFATAKKIVELRMSLSGERFANLKQLENIPRVNWDQLIEEDLIFIS
jgi:DNA uptake protein ComE-like DNA-binding protein